MRWGNVNNIKENIYNLPGDWLHIQYFELLNILFRFENSLRIFAYIILKDNFKDEWINVNITSDDGKNSTIKTTAKKRISQDKKFEYLGYSSNNPLMYLTSGELISLITSDNYWKYFNKYFLGSKEIIKNKLDEIGNIRNSFAHFRAIKPGDVEVVKQNTKHTLGNIEEQISILANCNDIVPTNTPEQWYIELKDVKNEFCLLNFKQSKDKKWVMINFEFSPPILSKNEIQKYVYEYQTLKLNTPDLLKIKNKFTKHLIFAVENTSYRSYEKRKFLKITSLLFSRECLIKNFNEIKNEFNEIISKINDEIGLIKNDNLARGDFVESTYFYGGDEYKSDEYSYNQLKSNYSIECPPEYWGNISIRNDFISSMDKFPWMDEKISDDKTNCPF